MTGSALIQPVALTAAICTRNRPVLLARALASLLAQDPPPAEILIIDNAPSDDAARRVAAAQAPRVRYVREPSPGLDVARNRALREATQAVVGFLDDDAVADRRWAQAMAGVFSADPQAAVCTGRVEPFSLETRAQQLFEANGGFARGAERIELPADAGRLLHGRPAPLIAWAVSVGSGSSFAVRREAALAIGGFDIALDRGPALPGGGDHDMFWRLLCAGGTLVYEPSVLAWHEHRRSMASMAEQVTGHQRALVAFLCKAAGEAGGRRRADIVCFLLWRLVKPGARLIRRVFGRDPVPAAILWKMWTETWRGLWAYQPVRDGAEAGTDAA